MNRASDVDIDDLDIGLPTASAIANVYFQAARSLDLACEVLSSRYAVGVIRRGERELMVYDRWVGINDLTAATLSGNKHFAAHSLRAAGLPVPDFVLAPTASQNGAAAAARALIDTARGRYPVCIKPVRGSHGQGVVPDIRDEEELLQVVYHDEAAARADTLVEAQLQGRHYRVVVAFDEVIGCVERTAPVVVGDGVATLAELVADYNLARSRYSLAPAQMKERQRFIIERRDALRPHSVVESGRSVVLDERCNLKVGGNIHYVNVEAMAGDAKRACVEAAQLFDLKFAGLDLIGDDVTGETGRWFINEVNSQPAAHVPVPTMSREQRLDWPRRLLERYFAR